jgi:peptidoglycan/LPS O-acetylase OafA/YrhL
MKLSHIAPLDGVRATAALMVLFFHCFQITSFTSPAGLLIQKIGFLGQTGVSLFFVLSGFLITRILLKQVKDPNYLFNFFVRRALRIFPLYFIYLCIIYFFLPTIFDKPIPDFSQQWYYWFYLQDFAITFRWPAIGPKHFWSLAIEEHFYLIWPFIVLFASIRGVIVACLSLIVVSIITRIFLVQNGYETYFFTFARLDEISLGCFLAVLEHKKVLDKFSLKWIQWAFLIVVLSAAILWFKFTAQANPIIQVIKYQFISLTYLLGVAWTVLATKENLIIRFLSSKVMTFTGTISYGIYVYQALAIEWVKHYNLTNNLMFFVAVIIAIYLIASISFYGIEKPILSLKNILTPQPAQ